MPLLSVTPSPGLKKDLATTLRDAIGGANPLEALQAQHLGAQDANLNAQTQYHQVLSKKVLQEYEDKRNAEKLRADPAANAQAAGDVAGMNTPDASRLMGHIRGAVEPYSSNDAMDAGQAGAPVPSYTMAAPNLQPGQRDRFQNTLAALQFARLGAGNDTADNIAQAGGHLQSQGIVEEARQAALRGDVGGVNRLSAGVLGRKELTPFNTNEKGVVTNEWTGAAPGADGLLSAYTAAENALGTQRKAVAGAADARARATSAKATPAAVSADGMTLPGGAGAHLLQQSDTGDKFAFNEKTGKAWKAAPDGSWAAIPIAELPKNVGKIGAGGATQGNREAVFTQRVVTSANQAAKDLSNVVQLPLSASTGLFGGRKQGPGLLDAGKEVLANKMTDQEAQSYNAMATGFQRSLAAIESAGLMPSGTLTHQMDAVLFKEGDTNLTKLHKLAQTRQIIESGMEVLDANPRVSDTEKAKIKAITESVQKAVPFTHSDLIRLTNAQEINPKATLKDVVGKIKPAGAAPPAPAGMDARVWAVMTPEERALWK